ncbi:MAG: hypothetical protein DI620_04610 [Haemophilus parainfluenzae]|nr:MAG: hypothetical protein DI620_04610 [Haemophilus parainfluenzae]
MSHLQSATWLNHMRWGKKQMHKIMMLFVSMLHQISYQVKPPYPADARRDGVEGAVRLQVEVLSDNRVGNVQVVHSSGSALLDKSAVDTVKNKYRFEAKIHNGAPVASLVTFTVKFVLEEESW